MKRNVTASGSAGFDESLEVKPAPMIRLSNDYSVGGLFCGSLLVFVKNRFPKFTDFFH